MQDDVQLSAVRRGRIVMTAYLVFASAVTLFYFGTLPYRDLYKWIVPFTGWGGLTTYLWTLFFAATAARTPDRRSFALVIAMLGVTTAIEALDCIRSAAVANNNFNNPYLTFDPRRPLITVLPPLVWIAALWITRRSLPDAMPGWAGGCGPGAKVAG